MYGGYYRFFFNWIADKFGPDLIHTPLNAQIELTLKCNAKCKFCSIWKSDYRSAAYRNKREMTTAEVKKIIDDLNDMKVTVLSFTGGEPTLREDIGELVDYTVEAGMMPTVVTNGYYLEKMLREGTLGHPNMLVVSLDAPSAELHNYFRGIDIFDKTLNGIRLARRKNIGVIISTVITSLNIHLMEDMCKFARREGCMLEMLPVENIVREEADKKVSVPDISGLLPDIRGWASEIRRLEKKYANLLTDPVTANIIENGGFGQGYVRGRFEAPPDFRVPTRYINCKVATAYIFIRFNGDCVFPCKIHPILSISALKYPVKKIYRTREVLEIRRKMDGFPFCKGCRLGCAINASIPYYWYPLWRKFLRGFLRGNFR